jgi:ankyrin repeat protein
MLMNDFNFELLQLLLSRNDLDPSKIPSNTDSLSERMRDAFNYALNSDLETAEDLISHFLIWCAIEGDARFPTPENAMLQLTWPILYYSLTWTPQHDGRGNIEIATYNIWNPSKDHRDKITECLKSQGLHTLTLKDSRERGFLHYVATLDNNEYVSCLLLHGADASARDSSGRTPLHAALKAGIESNARLLLESGANVSAVDSQNRSPLYCALESGHESFALLLLDNGAKASTADSDGWSALHWAAKKGCEEAVRRLLREGIDASTGDVSGWTDSTSDASIKNRPSPPGPRS